ncbi:YggS family pyridoxal phosphate-dependent enzyme [Agrococcus baldri]|uniref:Pyridoxal phosphate homeostasis protein n=1 Tax=Agrococcus baldri TaxID=153730 RepID=A0AA87RCX8_9MICO|nr:YggS family pyridoxal phosphate-dependent enzyme [Agrococcus baldri]GEK80795.1 YggS family pyridoxal phosphate enzyme [Agrococcus baldri]
MTDAPAARLAAFLEELEEVRQAREVSVIVVTKFHPAELVRELAAAGHRDFGENRHPEARDKAEALAELGLTWHFLGQLQRKKARQVARYADVLHSIDSLELVDALEGGEPGDERGVRDALVQINLTDDPGRGGVEPERLEALAERVAASPALRLRGVMAVAPLDEEPGSAFARLATHAELVRRVDASATWISAGMSADWREAVRHGATHLRIGTAITGNRAVGG